MKTERPNGMDHIDLIAARMEQARFERGIPVAERAMRADEFVRLCGELGLGLEAFAPPGITHVSARCLQQRLYCVENAGKPATR